MANWQRTLAKLAGLTSEQKEDAEVAIPSMYTTTKECNFFLRGTDEEACRRVSKLLAKGKRGPTPSHGLDFEPLKHSHVL